MKLKKIASLMLAGIMAVSMLAACGEGKKEENPGSSSSEVTTVSGAAAAINAELDKNKDKISFEGDSDLDKGLSAYFAVNPIKADEWDGKAEQVFVQDAALVKAINNFVNAQWNGLTNTKAVMERDSDTTKQTAIVVSAFNTKAYTESAALKYVGRKIDELALKEDSTNTTDGKVYSYSGTASVIEVKSEKGAESVWLVTVVLTKDYVVA